MTEIRSVDSLTGLDAFAALEEEGAESLATRLRKLEADGLTRPEWWYIMEKGDEPIGRVAYMTDSPLELDEHGGLIGDPPLETALVGLWLRWGKDDAIYGPRLLAQTTPQFARFGPPVDARVNSAVHDHPEKRRRVLEAVGFGIFQEKVGHLWRDTGEPIEQGDRLIFRTLDEVGREDFAAAISLGIADTLDRNDRYFRELVGPERWGEEMLRFLGDGDEASWRLAYDTDGQLAGYVMLSAFDEEGVATIAHIGVVPEQRGNRYSTDLLLRASADARERGFREILSDVDVDNQPMLDAMVRAGHLPGLREWHVWHYRFPAPS